jgi:hypothetical protein
MRARGVFNIERLCSNTLILYQLCHLLLVELVFRLQSYANVSRTSVLCFVLRTRCCAHGFAARLSTYPLRSDDVDENKNQLSDQRNLKNEIQIGSR